jgi:hypothetical protein
MAFDVETPAPAEISQVTWIRLPSVTHSFDQNQRINFLTFRRGANKVTVTAPPNGNVCPPGHYMLFLLDQNKVPSTAAIIQITAAAAPQLVTPALTQAAAELATPIHFTSFSKRAPTPLEQDAAIQAQEKHPAVVVGVTPTCPYGISACWAGAYEALTHLHGVRLVRPVPNAQDSTAYVYLAHNGLPDLELWRTQFAAIANGTHILRGVEVTIEDVLNAHAGETLIMHGNDVRPPLLLQPMEATDKIQWDATKGSPKPSNALEMNAYLQLQQQVKSAGGAINATVTGPLRTSDHGYVLEVREFSIPAADGKA